MLQLLQQQLSYAMGLVSEANIVLFHCRHFHADLIALKMSALLTTCVPPN